MDVISAGRPAVTDMPVRRLGLGDLRDCLLLAIDRRWLPEEAKWRLLFEVGEVYGIDDPGGGLAGTVVLARYGRRLGAISMVLVASRHGRRGLGRRLMTHVLQQARGATLFLSATEYGRGLYQKLGFAMIGTAATHVGHLRPRPADLKQVDIRPAREADLGAVMRLDARACGAARPALISRLPAFADRTRVAERDGTVAGFGAAWRNLDTVMIGPVIADGTAMARALIAGLAVGVHGPVRLDVDRRHAELAQWVVARGASPAFSTTLMTRGGPLPGDRDRIFSPFMLALG